MDNSLIGISQKIMETLQLACGDVVVVRAKYGKETVLIVTPVKDLNDESAQMNSVVRRNLNVKLGDAITIHQCRDIKQVRMSLTS
jgi:transitional endoplasmic reticulum ATPase